MKPDRIPPHIRVHIGSIDHTQRVARGRAGLEGRIVAERDVVQPGFAVPLMPGEHEAFIARSPLEFTGLLCAFASLRELKLGLVQH